MRSCPPEEVNAPGKVKCMVLIYEGTDAVAKIRTVLGPTDPTKAPDGTIRREFGKDVMVNTAHASDSQESYERETRVIKIDRDERRIGLSIKALDEGFSEEDLKAASEEVSAALKPGEALGDMGQVIGDSLDSLDVMKESK